MILSKKQILTTFGIGIVCSASIFSLSQAATTDVYLSIVNSFSGTAIISSGQTTENSGTIFTNQNPLILDIQADTGNINYLISGSTFSPVSGYLSDPFLIHKSVLLSLGDGPKTLQTILYQGGEALVTNPLSFFLDTTPPSTPIIIQPVNGQNITDTSLFSRSASIDSWAGFKEFEYFFSSDSSFASTILVGSTPNNEILLWPSQLGTGNRYRMILAKDNAGNTSISSIGNICIDCTTTTTPPANNGGTSPSLPNTQTSTSSIPTPKFITLLEENLNDQSQIQDIQTPTTPANIGFLDKILYSKEEISAYQYAYQHGITTMGNISDANLGGPLVRKHLAKMISEYAIRVMKKKPDNTALCQFSDTTGEDIEMQYYTRLACKLGLMGRESDGDHIATLFNPNNEVTRAQFWTIFSRLLFGGENNIKPGESTLRYEKHLTALNKEWIMKLIDQPEAKELRWRVMMMMLRADKKL